MHLPGSAPAPLHTRDFLHHSQRGAKPQTNSPGTYSAHNASIFPSKQWQQTGTSNTVLLSSLIHDDVTHRFFGSEREAFPRFWGQRYPWPIHHALCANDRLMQTRHQEQSEAAGMKRSESTVRGCDLKDCKAVIRIFNQDFHNPSRYKGKGGDTHTYFFISSSCNGQSEFWGIKKKGIWMSYAHKQVLFREWRVKDFLGLHSYCISSAHSRLRAAQPLRLWERGTALPLSPLTGALTDTWAKK